MNLRSAVTLAVDRVVAPIEGIHRTISSHWFGALGPIARPVQFGHDTIAAVVYRTIRAGSAVVGWGVETSEPSPATIDSVQAWVNGLWGDALGRQHRTLELQMTIRDARGDAVTPAEASSTSGHAPTSHLAFLMHGLVETERRWMGSAGQPGLARVIDTRGSVNPILIRYNTGLPVKENGARLADLIQRVVDGWPRPVESISLVGHSMGGLVATSACVAAVGSERTWIDRLTDVVTIGTPHGGAPLEKLAVAATWGLNVAASTRPLAVFLDRRSQGIKDLAGGMAVATMPGRLGGVRHHFVGGVLTRDPSHLFGALVGDLMVRPSSSTASGFVEPSNTMILGGVHHFNLLDEPAVIDRVADWLDPINDEPALEATAHPAMA